MVLTKDSMQNKSAVKFFGTKIEPRRRVVIYVQCESDGGSFSGEYQILFEIRE